MLPPRSKTGPADSETDVLESEPATASSLPAGIPPRAVSIEFTRSRGAGGQHVNKVSTAVQLRLTVDQTDLPLHVKARLLQAAGTRATKAGDIILRADRHRSQVRNRDDAYSRLAELIAQARQVPKRRRATRVSATQKLKRRNAKQRRGTVKKLRGRPPSE